LVQGCRASAARIQHAATAPLCQACVCPRQASSCVADAAVGVADCLVEQLGLLFDFVEPTRDAGRMALIALGCREEFCEGAAASLLHKCALSLCGLRAQLGAPARPLHFGAVVGLRRNPTRLKKLSQVAFGVGDLEPKCA
jgi:hypothetical protein